MSLALSNDKAVHYIGCHPKTPFTDRHGSILGEPRTIIWRKYEVRCGGRNWRGETTEIDDRFEWTVGIFPVAVQNIPQKFDTSIPNARTISWLANTSTVFQSLCFIESVFISQHLDHVSKRKISWWLCSNAPEMNTKSSIAWYMYWPLCALTYFGHTDTPPAWLESVL